MPFYTCKRFCPLLSSPKHNFVLKEISWDIGIRPVSNLPADNKGKRDKNKTRAYFFCIQYSLMRISKPSIRKNCLWLEEICPGVCMTYINWINCIFIFQQLHVISTFVHSMAIALSGRIKRTVSVSRAVRPTSSLSVEQMTPPTGICVSSRRPAVRRDDESTRRTLGSASNLVSMWGPVSREAFFYRS